MGLTRRCLCSPNRELWGLGQGNIGELDINLKKYSKIYLILPLIFELFSKGI